jgi:hypothetical protein
MVGAEAGEVMGVVQVAMQTGAPYTVLRDAVLAHPTMAEGLNSLFSGVKIGAAGGAPQDPSKMPPRTAAHRVEADGVRVFYREAGPKDAPVFGLQSRTVLNGESEKKRNVLALHEPIYL